MNYKIIVAINENVSLAEKKKLEDEGFLVIVTKNPYEDICIHRLKDESAAG